MPNLGSDNTVTVHSKVKVKKNKSLSKTFSDIGYCNVFEHDIDTGDSRPIKQSPRRPQLFAGDAEHTILNEMLATGVIEPSISEWASRVYLVKKPDGSYRFCRMFD